MFRFFSLKSFRNGIPFALRCDAHVIATPHARSQPPRPLLRSVGAGFRYFGALLAEIPKSNPGALGLPGSQEVVLEAKKSKMGRGWSDQRTAPHPIVVVL